MSFKLNDQQEAAVYKALNWYYLESHKRQLFVVGGLAGTGKSTCLRSIIEAIGLSTNSVLYCALTGKAVSVLRMKGHMANTIHRSFYNAKPYKNSVFFSKKQLIPKNIKLIVIDEFGMVGDSLTNDILSFGVPVIALGDPGQLPPVFEKNTFIENEENLDVFLDKVMRTDDTSGILTLAMIARNKKPILPGNYGFSRALELGTQIKPMLDYNKVLCWTNKTRKHLNSHIREQLGITSKYPVKGEKVMFLGNRYDKSIEYLGIELCIVNGMECEVIEDSTIENDYQINIKARPMFVDDNDIYFDVTCNRRIFDGYTEFVPDLKTLRIDDIESERDSVFCDFAWAATTTSSQGSEWADVLVIDEMPKYRPEYSRWIYTAITRAACSVDILIDQQH